MRRHGWRLWRWLPPNQHRWGDAGQLVEGIGAVRVTLTLAFGVGSAINYANSELNGPGKPPPIRPSALATFKAPPDNDCGKKVLGDFAGTVSFQGGMWTAPDTSTPKLPYQPDEGEIVKYNKDVTAWNALMTERVGVVLRELDNHDCYKVQPPIASSSSDSSSESELKADINGTYDVDYTNGGGPCVPQFTTTIDVSLSGGNVTITRGDDHSSITAPLRTDLSFTFAGADSTGNRVLASGVFQPGGGRDVNFRGSSETTFSGGSQKSCSYDMSGKRR